MLPLGVYPSYCPSLEWLSAGGFPPLGTFGAIWRLSSFLEGLLAACSGQRPGLRLDTPQLCPSPSGWIATGPAPNKQTKTTNVSKTLMAVHTHSVSSDRSRADPVHVVTVGPADWARLSVSCRHQDASLSAPTYGVHLLCRLVSTPHLRAWLFCYLDLF